MTQEEHGRVASHSQEETAKPEPPLSAIMMAAIGGLLAFFGLFFGLIAAIAEPGFLAVALITCGIATVLFFLAFLSRRNQLREWKVQEERSIMFAKCVYCGLQNDKGIRKCQSCGAPLGQR
jgi:predicted lipid-binding transport protein (Tim44 family)